MHTDQRQCVDKVGGVVKAGGVGGGPVGQRFRSGRFKAGSENVWQPGNQHLPAAAPSMPALLPRAKEQTGIFLFGNEHVFLGPQEILVEGSGEAARAVGVRLADGRVFR